MQCFRNSLAVALAAAPLIAAGQTASELADLGLDQLSRIEVTSVGKRLQRIADVPGSVYVITAEEIRRSGASSLPEVLRLAPNLQVARVDSAQYAISARSGADVLANKMLVQVDGRTIYSPLFSGVFWESEDLLLDDIERIEVLSGSGGTLYGSNAFHGVISIVTRSALDTGGTLLKTGAGTHEKFATARQGFTGERGGLRVVAKRRLTDRSERENGTGLRDASQHTQAGFRWDSAAGSRQWMASGGLFRHGSEAATGLRNYEGAHVLGRFIADDRGRRTQVQAYADRIVREQQGVLRNTVDTLDIEAQQQQSLGGVDLLTGAGWRRYSDDAEPANAAAIDLVPRRRILRLWNVFAQGEIAPTASTRIGFGLKAEHNDYTGLEWLPTLRLSWKPARDHLFWAAASRVVRTPARVDRDVRSFPLVPSPDFDSERANILEAGWRGRYSAALDGSLAFFVHDFARLRSFDLAGTTGTFGNNYSGRLRGAEGWLQWRASDRLRVKAGFLRQSPRYEAQAGTAPTPASSTLGNDTTRKYTLGFSWDLRHNVWVDLNARHIGERPSPRVPSYTAADLRIGWRPSPDVELTFAVRNLTDRAHAEWGAAATAAQIPRSALLQIVWWR
ncbi:TonB-dependent receptor plug domain-containing protein [Ramlibacter sp.]|uniref:TonB-dependent receptor plug domain-containing protein n=1 Tax=Ramlibacter sp. TaxID=1917967 RepID=UPI003D12033B